MSQNEKKHSVQGSRPVLSKGYTVDIVLEEKPADDWKRRNVSEDKPLTRSSYTLDKTARGHRKRRDTFVYPEEFEDASETQMAENSDTAETPLSARSNKVISYGAVPASINEQEPLEETRRLVTDRGLPNEKFRLIFTQRWSVVLTVVLSFALVTLLVILPILWEIGCPGEEKTCGYLFKGGSCCGENRTCCQDAFGNLFECCDYGDICCAGSHVQFQKRRLSDGCCKACVVWTASSVVALPVFLRTSVVAVWTCTALRDTSAAAPAASTSAVQSQYPVPTEDSAESCRTKPR